MRSGDRMDQVSERHHGTGASREAWPKFSTRRLVEAAGDEYDLSREEIRDYAAGKPWVWPRRTVHFLCDLHADADAFLRSLSACGAIERLGPADDEFEITAAGRQATLVVGGDCLDKGPSNLRLLRVLRALLDKGADLDILAGNHDVRALVGLSSVGRKDDPRYAHLFVRMGRKTVPLLREIHDEYLAGGDEGHEVRGESEIRAFLFPDESWYREFPAAVAGSVRAAKLAKEIRRIREKTMEFEQRAAELGLTMAQAYAAVRKSVDLFLTPDGEFSWFYRRMRIARREGSFLFVHAGLDDATAAILRWEDVAGLNRRFRRLLEEDLFGLYHGPIGNAFRTKYRDEDLPMSEHGVASAHAAGVYAVVHGHRAITRGQRLVLRGGLLNFECDVSVDTNTRELFGLEGPGYGVVTFLPDGRIVARSADYPHVKVFDAASNLGWTLLSPADDEVARREAATA